jgi:phosphatidylethanolamine/phosphatidyl-N-methylethanolamine N-methyltransferase
MSALREEPREDDYLERWSGVYEKLNYDSGLAGWFLDRSHRWSEQRFRAHEHFADVLEVGAGSGAHLSHVRHGFDRYWMTDVNPRFLEQASRKRDGAAGEIIVRKENARELSFENDAFDRVIAAHVLEHLAQPHLVLREWARVVKPGGILTLVLPCDPGFAWRLGRHFGPRDRFVRAGIDYDYWMAREHVNPVNNLVAFVRFFFPDLEERWLPSRVPSIDLNLFYVAHARVR